MTYEGELLATAATWMARQVNESEFTERTQSAVNWFGKDLLAELRANDEAAMFFPAVIFLIDGKPRLGCVMTVADRALFAWTHGRLQTKRHVEVVPFASISKVLYSDTEPSGRPVDTIIVQAAQTWQLELPKSLSAGAFKMAPLLCELLGAIAGRTSDTPLKTSLQENR
jgi:hypothetical protein